MMALFNALDQIEFDILEQTFVDLFWFSFYDLQKMIGMTATLQFTFAELPQYDLPVKIFSLCDLVKRLVFS